MNLPLWTAVIVAITSVMISAITSVMVTFLASFFQDKYKKASERRSFFYQDIEFFAGRVDDVREMAVKYRMPSRAGKLINNRNYAQITGMLHGLTEFIGHIPDISPEDREELARNMMHFRRVCTSNQNKKKPIAKAELLHVLRTIEQEGNYLMVKFRSLRFKPQKTLRHRRARFYNAFYKKITKMIKG